jgi:hypothetical protein
MFLTSAAVLLALAPDAGKVEPPTPEAVRRAVGRALPLLLEAAQGHADQQTCFACHNQALPVIAFAAARGRGFEVPEEELAAQAEHIAGFLGRNRERFLKGQGTGGQADTAGYALLTLERAGWKPDETTAAVAEYLLRHQADGDHWRTTSNRPPSEASPFTTNYLALHGLRVWGTPAQRERVAKRVAATRGWLLKTPARDTEDRVFRLLALKEAGADEAELRAAARALREAQRPDGGWGQTDALASDAYATGSALVALHEAGGLAATDPAYRRGLAFLVGGQLADGSWLVRSRSKPFQPYYESGFPHGKDQFISAAASGWATAALALACPREPAKAPGER